MGVGLFVKFQLPLQPIPIYFSELCVQPFLIAFFSKRSMLIDIIVSNIQEFIDTLEGDGTIVENFGIRIILLQPGENRIGDIRLECQDIPFEGCCFVR